MRAHSKSSSGRLERSSRAWLAPLAALALIGAVIDLSWTSTVWADDPAAAAPTPGPKTVPIEQLPRPTSEEEGILAALDKPTSVEFVEEPLQDVVNDLKDLHEIEIQLDDKALDDAGIARDTPITLPRVKDIPFKSVLAMLRRKYGLHYLVQDGMLLVTSKEVAEADENLLVKVYPVGHFVEQQDYDSLVKVITTTLERNTWQTSRPVRSIGMCPLPPGVPAVTAPTTGCGTVVALKSSKCLVISQTRDVHDKVLELLQSLDAARKFADTAVGSK